MPERCLCGATDCPRCYPSTWWHDPDTCTGDDCDCVDPHDYDIEPPDDYDHDDAREWAGEGPLRR